MLRVGFIGLGSQGGPMAQRIVDEGYPLTVWARRQGSVDALSRPDAAVAKTPRDVGLGSDLVGICVLSDDDVEQVLSGPQGVFAGMAPGGVVAIHSTVHPDTCRRLADEGADRQISVIDAPVSGGGGAASAGRLLVMVGGTADQFERCRPVFSTFGDPILHLGPIGAGQLAKLLNNLLFTAQISIALDTISFADELGVDRNALAEVLAHGSGGSRAIAILAASGFDTSGMKNAVAVLQKDFDLILHLAMAKEATPPQRIADLARQTLDLLRESRP